VTTPAADAHARNGKPHRWRFYRSGGVDQVQLRDGKDLAHLSTLDEKLWVAVAMPTKGVHFDPKTLAALDLDSDGRVRLPEILQAVEWLDGHLESLDHLFEKGSELPLSAIKDGPVLAGARRILANLGKAQVDRISVADVADTAKVFAETRFNGDGVVPPESSEDAGVKQAIEDIINVLGSVPDRSGKPGVDRAKLETFFAEARAIRDWQAKGDAVNVLGDATAKAAAALGAVAGKVEDYFVRCRLAAYDGRAAAAMLGTDADLAAVAALDLSATPAELRRLPLARIEAARPLPLEVGLNPAWSSEVAALASDCIAPAFGAKSALTEQEWSSLKSKLSPYQTWLKAKPASAAVEKLGLERVLALSAGDAETQIGALIVQDLALEAESAQIAAVEKLCLLQRDFIDVLHNFVNFSDFYAHKGATFQAGTLVLDGRSCRLCLEVTDAGRHSAMAAMAGAYLAYCECTRGAEKMIIAAAFTDGDADYLIVGRNGIFYDRKGRDWDATITKIISNPISVREAFWSPYKKLARLIEQQVGKRAAAADKDADDRLAKTAEKVAAADQDPASGKPDDDKPKIDVGTVAAIGVAIGGIGAMVAGIMTAFFGLGAWMPIGFLGVMVAISGPSMLLAYLKLRQRNLGPLLDANGWAINGRAKINVPFGGALTDVARLPAGAERSMKDPYAEKKKPWRFYFFLVLLVVLGVSWYVGKLDRFLPDAVKSVNVLHKN
jgi:hypothetical protein